MIVARLLVASAACPTCGPVYLGYCMPDTTKEPVERYTAPANPRTWMCEHLAPDGLHQWRTCGPIEFRPVSAIHVKVVAKARG